MVIDPASIGSILDWTARAAGVLRFFQKKLRKRAVLVAIESAASAQQREDRKSVKASLQAWVETIEVRALLAGVEDGRPFGPVTDKAVAEMVRLTKLPSATRATSEGIIEDFTNALMRALQRDDAEGRYQIIQSVSELRKQIAALERKIAAPDALAVDAWWNKRLDEGKELAEQQKWTAALAVFQQIEGDTNRDTDLEPNTKFRLNANLGIALFAKGRADEAATYLLRALDYKPNDTLALGNLAQSAQFRGDRRSAEMYCKRALAADPNAQLAWSVLIQVSEPEIPLSDIPESVRNKTFVLMGRSIVAGRNGRTGEAIELLKEALRGGSRDPQVLVLLSETVLYQSAKSRTRRATDPEVFQEVLRLTNEAIEALEQADVPEMLARALVARSHANSEIDPAKTLEDLKRAFALNGGSLTAGCNMARALIWQEDAAGALFVLNQIPASAQAPIIDAIRARALLALGRTDDVPDCIASAVTGRDDQPNPHAYVLELADVAVQAKHHNVASELLATLPTDFEPAELRIVRARIALANKDIATAQVEYDLALTSADPADVADICNECGIYLVRAHMSHLALPYFERGYADTDDMTLHYFARACMETHSFSRAASILADLRKRAHMPDWAVDLAARIAIARDDLREAQANLEELMCRLPDDVETRIQLAHVMHRQGDTKRSLEVIDPIRDREDIDAEDMMRIAQLYAYGRRKEEALQLAYKAVLGAPNDPNLKPVYAWIFHQAEKEPLVEASSVGPDTWVSLSDQSGGRDLEYFIVSNPVRGHPTQIAADDETAVQLLGKSVDDIIEFAGGLVTRRYRVSEIKSGYVHVFQDIFQNFSKLHPNSQAIQEFRVDESNIMASIAPVLLSLDQRAAHAKQMESYYDGGAPLGLLAHLADGKLNRVYAARAGSVYGLLHTERGDFESRVRSSAAASSDRRVVLTIPALLSLHKLKRLDLLIQSGKELIAPQSMPDEINEEISSIKTSIEDGGSQIMAKSGEGYRFVDIPPESFRDDLIEMCAIRDFVGKHVNILPRPYEALEPSLASFREGVGPSSYDAFALADEDTDIFADDIGLRTIAQNDRRAEGFSTITLVGAAALKGHITVEEAHRDHATLIEMNHSFVPLSGPMLYQVLVDERYTFTKRVLKCFERLSVKHSNTGGSINVAVDLLRLIATSALGSAALEQAASLVVETVSREAEDPDIVFAAFRYLVPRKLALLPLAQRRVLERVDAVERSRLKGTGG